MNFIAIEGLDGAGKSTQVALLQQHVERGGRRCKCLHFPRMESKPWGEMIASFLRGDFGKVEEVNPYLAALLYAEDRHAAAAEVSGWLRDGYFVIVDRYVYSNVAFQCAKQPEPAARARLREWILQLEYGHFGIPAPERYLFLDVPFSFTQAKLSQQRTGDDRRYLNGKADIHESSLDLQRSVRSVYLEQPPLDPSFRAISCCSAQGEMLQPEETFEKIRREIET
jgi:dTMP kinase